MNSELTAIHHKKTVPAIVENEQTASGSKSTDIFEWLMLPLTEDAFINDVWEQKPYIVSRKDRSYYDQLFTAAQFDSLLEFERFVPTEIRVVCNGKQAPVKEYIKANGRVDIGRISQYYLEGHSIVLHSLENFHPAVAGFTQAMRHFFSANVLVNAYITPAGAQALHPHFDAHDVFIMQIEGSKNWRLYHSAAECPLLGSPQPSFSAADLPEPVNITLQKGDALYIPRGWVHDAETTDERSLHLTIGIHPTQWVDLVSKTLAALSLTQPSLRRALPPGFLSKPHLVDRLQEQFVQLIDTVKEHGLVENACTILQHEFIQQEHQLPTGSLTTALDGLLEIDLDTTLEKRPNAYSLVVSSKDSVSIQFNNSTLQAPASYLDALDYISKTNGRFLISAIPGLADEKKVALAQRLVRDGLLLYTKVTGSGSRAN